MHTGVHRGSKGDFCVRMRDKVKKVISFDRAEKRLRMRKIFAGELSSGGVFDRLINGKF